MSYLLYVLSGLSTLVLLAALIADNEAGPDGVVIAVWLGSILTMVIIARVLQLLRHIRDAVVDDDARLGI